MKNSISVLFLIATIATACNQSSMEKRVLKVREIEFQGEAACQQASKMLEDQTDLHSISITNWQKFPYQPDVRFRIAHSNNQIWLKYYVHEKNILAKMTETNSAVHKDSCVEFFFDPKGDGNYYNFEFSCIGTRYVAHGSGRKNRQHINSEIIDEQIKIHSSLGTTPFNEKTGEHKWEMTIIIPSEALIQDQGIKLKGLNTRANFYKCGDDTVIPHYLSWNPIGTERPDFHQPTFFGNVIFE